MCLTSYVHVFTSKGCDVRVLEKSPGEYYTPEDIEQVKYILIIIFILQTWSSQETC